MLKLRLFAPTFISFVIAVLAFGCGDSRVPVDPCATTRACFQLDREACCTSSTLDVASCDACPAGYSERANCDPTNCAECAAPDRRDLPGFRSIVPADERAPGGLGAPTEPPPASCFEDLGSGCCGGETPWNASLCLSGCPVGSVQETECTGFGAACACGGSGDPLPMPDAGGGPPASDAGAIAPPQDCLMDFGGGCCGMEVARDICGRCPAGSIESASCVANTPDTGFAPAAPDAGAADGGSADAGGARPAPPNCHEDMGAGCCGAVLSEANACGMCAAGIPASSCTSFGPECPE